MSRLPGFCAAVAVAVAAASPAAADTRVRVTGIVNAPTGAALGVPLTAGDRFTATFTLGSSAFSVPLAPLGGTGDGRLYVNVLRALDIGFSTATGDFGITPQPGFFASGVVYDDGTSTLTPARVDYAGFIVPTVLTQAGIMPLLATDPALPAGVFPASFSFGRFGLGAGGALPDLLTSTALPDFGSFFAAPGATFLASFMFRSGNAFNGEQFAALPLSEFGIGSLEVTVLPEPASWVLLIGGFGAVGAAARRRRAATPARL